MQSDRFTPHVEKRKMLHKQRIFKEGRQKLIFEDQSIAIYNVAGIPIPYLSGLGKQDITGNCLMRLIIDRKVSFSLCNESNIIVSQCVHSALGQEPFYVLQLYDIH